MAGEGRGENLLYCAGAQTPPHNITKLKAFGVLSDSGSCYGTKIHRSVSVCFLLVHIPFKQGCYDDWRKGSCDDYRLLVLLRFSSLSPFSLIPFCEAMIQLPLAGSLSFMCRLSAIILPDSQKEKSAAPCAFPLGQSVFSGRLPLAI